MPIRLAYGPGRSDGWPRAHRARLALALDAANLVGLAFLLLVGLADGKALSLVLADR